MADLVSGVAVIIAASFVYLTLKLAKVVAAFRRTKLALSGIPCDPPHWFWGHIFQYPGPDEAGLLYQRELTRKYPYLSVNWLGFFIPHVFPSHPDTVKQILRTSEPKGHFVYHMIEPWLGEGLLLSKGDKWWRNRRLLTPAFHFEILRPYVAVNNRAVDVLIEKLEESYEEKRSLELFSDVSLLTLDVILRCAFSYDSNCQRLGNEDPYVKTVNEMAHLVIDRFFKFWLQNDFLYFLTPQGRQFKKCFDFVHQVATDIINRRKAELVDSKTEKEGQKRYLDFLDILLTARDESGEGLTGSEIRDEVDTFLFAGHDTTASAICWTLFSLAEHPEHQIIIQEEVDEVLKGRQSEDILWHDLAKLPYMTMCIKEALRLHSPVSFIQRQTTQPLTLGEVTIPPKTLISVCIYNIHHNPLIWENSTEYRPERFTPENCERRDPYAFVPFSAGPRNCIGQNFAMHEIKVVIARILRRFTLELDHSHKVEKTIGFVMKSKHGIWVKVKPRSR